MGFQRMSSIATLVLCLIASVTPQYFSTSDSLSAVGCEMQFADFCSPSDFENFNCTLSCSIMCNDTVHYDTLAPPWIYFTVMNDTSTSVMLFDDQYDTGSETANNVYYTWLRLTTFYSGYYRCQFDIKSNNDSSSISLYQDFQIWNTSGHLIGEECQWAEECLALNANCSQPTVNHPLVSSEYSSTAIHLGATGPITSSTATDMALTTTGEMGTTATRSYPATSTMINSKTAPKVCNCNGDFDISYNDQANSPACLQHKSIYENCNTNEQCYQLGESFDCIDNVCQCNGSWVTVAENNETKCLSKANFGEPCLYNESCIMLDDNAYCLQTCQCKDGYKIDSSQTYCAGTSLSILTTNCTPVDFNQDHGCNLTCTVSTYRTEFQLLNHSFIYFSSDPNVNVTLFDAIFDDIYEDDFYQAILPLSNYSSGYYQCDLIFEDAGDGTINNQKALFRVSNKRPVSLNSPCTSSSDCSTLNAQCDTTQTNSTAKTCNCNGYYSLSYNSYSDSPACLEHVGADGHCNVASQCAQTNESFGCSQTMVCSCNGQYTNVAENNNKSMCLKAAAINDTCNYNEQCSMSTVNSQCSHGFCGCYSGYSLNTTVNVCNEYIVTYDEAMSRSTIVGIILGCAFGIALIVAVILGRRVEAKISCRHGVKFRIKGKDEKKEKSTKESQRKSIQRSLRMKLMRTGSYDPPPVPAPPTPSGAADPPPPYSEYPLTLSLKQYTSQPTDAQAIPIIQEEENSTESTTSRSFKLENVSNTN